MTLRNKSAGHDAQNWIYRRRIAVGPILEPGPFSTLERVPYFPLPALRFGGKGTPWSVESNASVCDCSLTPLQSLYHRGREDVRSTQYPLLPFTLPQTRLYTTAVHATCVCSLIEKRARAFGEMIKTGIDVWVRPRPDHQELGWFGMLPLLPQN